MYSAVKPREKSDEYGLNGFKTASRSELVLFAALAKLYLHRVRVQVEALESRHEKAGDTVFNVHQRTTSLPYHALWNALL